MCKAFWFNSLGDACHSFTFFCYKLVGACFSKFSSRLLKTDITRFWFVLVSSIKRPWKISGMDNYTWAGKIDNGWINALQGLDIQSVSNYRVFLSVPALPFSFFIWIKEWFSLARNRSDDYCDKN
jgi:hypothetical protein